MSGKSKKIKDLIISAKVENLLFNLSTVDSIKCRLAHVDAAEDVIENCTKSEEPKEIYNF